ncbi:hypothetical protein SDC9_204446 [bioreactor metagenome]|uniref:Uncharacterized protein n=1 Tax=bioreactor metagenome TaxID=1076179 RepID=A0A645J8H1_9ZZZZ
MDRGEGVADRGQQHRIGGHQRILGHSADLAALEGVVLAAEVRLEFGERVAGGRQQILGGREHRGAVALQCGQGEIALAGEVVVHAALAHPGQFTHFAGAGGRIATLPHQLTHRRDQALLRGHVHDCTYL